jgi:methionine-rich copper-binding protein CopC
MRHNSNIATLALAAGLSLCLTAPVFAHAALVSSDPAPNATVAAPKTISITFNEKIVPAFSGFTVSMSDGMTIKLTGKLSDDGKTIVGTPSGNFMAGLYKLSWHATSLDDGHKTTGTFNFNVK